MMPDDFRQYAELWQEQIEPEELAQLQAMAKKIERAARGKWLLDVSLALTFVGVACLILWRHPSSLLVKLGYFLVAAICLWMAWWRHQITKASLATAVDDPRVFFENAIKNLRAEIKMSTTSLYLTPGAVVTVFLAQSVYGLTMTELLRKLYYHVPSRIVLVAGVFLFIYFIRDSIKMRRQLRRLESMRREWDEPQELEPSDGR